jgi:hypothetical protein
MSKGFPIEFDEHRGQLAQPMPALASATGECLGDLLNQSALRPAWITKSLTQTLWFYANGSSDFRNASRHRYRLDGSAKFLWIALRKDTEHKLRLGLARFQILRNIIASDGHYDLLQ